MVDGIASPNIPSGSAPVEFLGHELVGSARSTRRFPFSLVQNQIDSVVAANTATQQQLDNLGAIGAGGYKGFTTKAAMDSSLGYPANTLATVSPISDPANAGTYYKTSDSGGWALFSRYVAPVYDLTGEASTSGTSYTASSVPEFSLAVGTLFVFTPNIVNTGNVLLKINSLASISLRDNSGSQIAAGFAEAGKHYLCVIESSTQFRAINLDIVRLSNALYDLVSEASSDGLAYTASADPAFSVTIGTTFIFTPPVANTGNVTLAVNATGAVALTDNGGLQIGPGIVEAGKRLIVQVHSAAQFRALNIDPSKPVTSLPIMRNGVKVAQLSVTSNSELTLSSWVSGAFAEVARFDFNTGNLRSLFDVGYGATPSAFAAYYSPRNLPTYIDTYSDAYSAAIDRVAAADTVDIDAVTPDSLSVTRPFYWTAGQKFRSLYVTISNAVLDLSFFPIGKAMRVVCGNAYSGLILHLGQASGATFAGYSGSNTLTLNVGGSVSVERLSQNDFRVSPAAGTTITASTTTLAARTKHVVFMGQSNMARFVVGGGLYGLQSGLAALGITDSFWFTNAAIGESSLFKANVGSIATNYWWDNTTDSAGPDLIAAVASIQAAITAGQPAPSVVFWDQGEAQVAYMATSGVITHASVISTLGKVFGYLRTQLSLPSLKVGIISKGADDTANDIQAVAVREASLAYIKSDANCFQAHERYDTSRAWGNVHHTFQGQSDQGNSGRMAAVIGNILYGQTNFLGPFVDGFTITGANTVVVAISCVGGGSNALNVGQVLAPGALNCVGFGVYTDANILSASKYTITSMIRFFNSATGKHEVTITTKETITTARLVYFDGSGAKARNGRILKHATTGLPLRMSTSLT